MPKASLIRPALAAVALLSGAPAAFAQGGPARENSAGLMRQWAEDTAYSYLEAWSSSGGAAASEVRDIYGPRVSFYGRFVDRSGLYVEKRRFARSGPSAVRAPPGHDDGLLHVQSRLLGRSIIDGGLGAGERAFSRARRVQLGIGFAGRNLGIVRAGPVIERG